MESLNYWSAIMHACTVIAHNYCNLNRVLIGNLKESGVELRNNSILNIIGSHWKHQHYWISMDHHCQDGDGENRLKYDEFISECFWMELFIKFAIYIFVIYYKFYFGINHRPNKYYGCWNQNQYNLLNASIKYISN